jgi:polyisoprenoid-binding protein YceI
MLQLSWLSAPVAALLLTQLVPSTANQSMTLTIDAADSQVVILVGKAGLFGFVGHAHEVVAPGVRGDVTLDAADWQHSSVSLEFDTASLRVTGKDEPPADVPEVQRIMLSELVLDVKRFPTVAFRSRRVFVSARTADAADMRIEGDLTLHGTTRPTTIRLNVALDGESRLTARGAFSIKQTDFGMVPVTAVGGTVRVKDDLDIQFVLKASPSNDTRTVR